MESGGGQFFEQFIDDYFSECEEHLAAIRRILLSVESRGDLLDIAETQDLARALHTVKGLSGMVGLVEAEQIAHAVEDAVTYAVRTPERIDPALIELLFAGAAALAQRIEARKTGRPIDPATEFVRRVRTLIGAASPGAEVSSPPSADMGSPESGRTLRVTFTPAVELSRRGVTIETVRARLAAIGEITAASPHIHPSGGVYFEFAVRLGAGAGPDEAWRPDGMIWTEDDDAAPSAIVPFSAPEPASGHRPAPAPAAATAANMVRVDLTKLDETMRMIGELVVSRSRLQQAIDLAAGRVGDEVIEPIVAASDAIERQLRSLREGIMRIRLVPIGEVFERMRFAMREIAREHDKMIHLEFEGGDTELDKLVIDRILEPLMHLVRNAASHGIESPAARVAAGKPATGKLTLRARAAGDRIVVEVEDDGAGINVERVARRAHERGLIGAGTAIEPSTMLDVIASPGFSTTETADMASGRGVGMAVVVSTIRGLGGDLTLDSHPGEGTRFTIELPLTLMITDALFIGIGGQTMAVPQILLREILPLAEHPITPLENNRVISYRGAVLPLIDLAETFGLAPGDSGRHVLVVGSDSHVTGLIVDRVQELREIVVHSVADPYVNVTGVAGATERPDGSVSLILDVAAILRQHRHAAGRRSRPAIGVPRPAALNRGT